MNQRRRLLSLARKGDPKAISKLFELYQVRVFSGEMLNKINRAAKSAAAPDKTGHRPQEKPVAARKTAPVRAKRTGPQRSKAPYESAKATAKRKVRHR